MTQPNAAQAGVGSKPAATTSTNRPYDEEWAIQFFQLQQRRITEVAKDAEMRDKHIERVCAQLFVNLRGSDDILGALRRAGVMPPSVAPAFPPPPPALLCLARMTRVPFQSDDDRAVRLYAVQWMRISAVCGDHVAEREARLHRARLALLRNLCRSPDVLGALRRAGLLPGGT